MPNDLLIMFLLRINNHNHDKEHTNNAYGMDRPLV
jgi:hypothetical protein